MQAVKNKPEHFTQWNSILLLAHSMHKYAEAGDWEKVITMESQRQEKLADFFNSNKISEKDSERVADGIRRILEIDRKIMELGKSSMNELSEQMRVIHKGQKARKAYSVA